LLTFRVMNKPRSKAGSLTQLEQGLQVENTTLFNGAVASTINNTGLSLDELFLTDEPVFNTRDIAEVINTHRISIGSKSTLQLKHLNEYIRKVYPELKDELSSQLPLHEEKHIGRQIRPIFYVDSMNRRAISYDVSFKVLLGVLSKESTAVMKGVIDELIAAKRTVHAVTVADPLARTKAFIIEYNANPNTIRLATRYLSEVFTAGGYNSVLDGIKYLMTLTVEDCLEKGRLIELIRGNFDKLWKSKPSVHTADNILMIRTIEKSLEEWVHLFATKSLGGQKAQSKRVINELQAENKEKTALLAKSIEAIDRLKPMHFHLPIKRVGTKVTAHIDGVSVVLELYTTNTGYKRYKGRVAVDCLEGSKVFNIGGFLNEVLVVKNRGREPYSIDVLVKKDEVVVTVMRRNYYGS